MKNIKLFFLSFIVLIYNVFSQEKDTLYFNAKWEKTTKKDHKFYRPLPLKKVDSLSFIQDFYRNGNLQMQGYVYTNQQNKYVGDIFWYTKEGYDASNSQYINSTNQPLTYYHNNGKVWKINTYKNAVKHGKIKLYNNSGVEIGNDHYKNGLKLNDTIHRFSRIYYSTNGNKKIAFNANVKRVFKSVKAMYWMNTGKLATITNYDKHNHISEEKIYEENGDLLKTYTEDDFLKNDFINGNYYEAKTNNGFVVAIDSSETYSYRNQIVKINDINLIHIEDQNVDFYKKAGSNVYQSFYYDILYDDYNNKTVTAFTTDGFSTRKYVYDKIFDKDDTVITINQVKEQSVEELFQSLRNVAWGSNYIEKKRYANDSIKHKTSFKYFTNQIFAYVDEAFDTNKHGGFGSFYTEKDDDKKKWRVDDQEFFSTYVFLLNENKPILVLTKEDDVVYCIIPTNNDKFVVNFKDNNDSVIKKMNYVDFNNYTLEMLMRYQNAKEFYNVKKNKQKQFLTNTFNEIILEKGYDSIQLAQQYIIAKDNNKIDVYNLQLKKLPLKNIRQVYNDRGNLQVLTSNEVYYVDVLGNKTNRNSISYSFCGTVSSTDFSIMKHDSKASVNAIKIHYGGMGRGYSYNEILEIDNLDTSYDLKFLNNTKQDGYDGNSGFVDGYVNRTNMLVVSKNKKFGLYTFTTENVKFKRRKNKNKKKTVDENGIELPEIIDINAPEYGKTQAKELLPVMYDSITLREPLIIVEKDNSYGIFSSEMSLQYKILGKVYNNFMSYEKLNGEKGWIDVRTLQEFPNL
ncbi:toxin-antitoxin system YwqK family antitoxin [Tenacibaculum jejuense]|uniref:Uncharacterized protein n=1 Tax=Tenacibaculum jejuense TaxID=584609 RepID=A0A238U9B3_9FLAO|nr:hypothetical protein [Tenacibaculum jejuense]SNR15692.1 protein of unknown function [Tenacibaculum jejuense]